MKILWITNLPSPYRVDFFNLLAEKSSLKVLFVLSKSKNRKTAWLKVDNNKFSSKYLKGFKLKSDHIISFGSLFHISRKYELVVISNPMSFVGFISIFWSRLIRQDFIIVGDGAIRKTESKIKWIIKAFILKGAKMYLSTSKMHDYYYQKYKVPIEKIKRYHFSSIYSHEILDKDFIQSNKKIRLYSDSYIVKLIFVGSLIPRKGIDILIRAMRLLNNVELNIYGGTKNEFLKNFKDFPKISSNVYFHGFANKESILNAMKSSDIFVFPSRQDIWGLVINEAISQGLPVISTTNVVSGTELVKENVNGFLIQNVDEIKLAKYINNYIVNKPKIINDSLNSLEIIRDYTLEKMVDDHLRLFHQN